MSNAVSALGNVSFDGFAKVREIGPVGMISLRAKPEVKDLAKAIKAAVGVGLPLPRQIEVAGDRAAAWMSPDEYLLILPYGETAAAMAALDKALKGEHASHPDGAGGGGVLARGRWIYPGLFPLGCGICHGFAEPFGNGGQ